MEVKTVGVACDHAGFALKQFVLQYLEEKGYPVKDYGTWSDASVDYPDFGHATSTSMCAQVCAGYQRLHISSVSTTMPTYL